MSHHPIAQDRVKIERKEIGAEIHDNRQGRFVILQEFGNGKYCDIRFPASGLTDVINMLTNLQTTVDVNGD